MTVSWWHWHNHYFEKLMSYHLRQSKQIQEIKIKQYVQSTLALSFVFALGGDITVESRKDLCDFILKQTQIRLPCGTSSSLLIDNEFEETGKWSLWQTKVPPCDIDASKGACHEMIVPTADSVRYMNLINILLNERKPTLLCGPPGSRKTSIILKTLLSRKETFVKISISSADISLFHSIFFEKLQLQKNQQRSGPKSKGSWQVLK